MPVHPAAQVVLAVAALIVAWQGRRIALKVGNIDWQVNNVSKSAPTLRQNVDSVIEQLRAVNARLDNFLTVDELHAELSAIHTRLREMAEAARRHHPEDYIDDQEVAS